MSDSGMIVLSLSESFGKSLEKGKKCLAIKQKVKAKGAYLSLSALSFFLLELMAACGGVDWPVTNCLLFSPGFNNVRRIGLVAPLVVCSTVVPNLK